MLSGACAFPGCRWARRSSARSWAAEDETTLRSMLSDLVESFRADPEAAQNERLPDEPAEAGVAPLAGTGVRSRARFPAV
jgi:hypothetical protein